MVSSALSPALAACAQLAPGSRVAVVGSREFPDLSLVSEFVASLPSSCVVVSGAARGVDSVAASSARRRGLHVSEISASWSSLGRSAGVVRNAELVSCVDVLVAFHDGVSPGTASSVSLARRSGVPCFVVSPPPAPGQPVQASLF